ncbi:MAG: DNA gyrase inhibitor YacG [Betaproteobacteria bacterium HGW-Betaproteobacteria-11]|nr:MAG: DNA gyrase inhibitor YacG [Betaproteobacteria bacterium HGW-Betaproteobacteria-11]
MTSSSQTTQRPRSVPCPVCGCEVVWSEESPCRPFCSARCKGVDLGAWASGEYRVQATEKSEPGQESE